MSSTSSDSSSESSMNCWDTSCESSSESDSSAYEPGVKKQKKNANVEKELKLKSIMSSEHVLKIHYRWIINKYLKTTNNLKCGQKIESPVFSAGLTDEYEFQLHLYPRGITETNKNYLALYLILKSCEEPELQIYFKYEYYAHPKVLDKNFEIEDCIAPGHKLGFKRLVKSDSVHNHSPYLYEHKLIFDCEIKVTINKIDKTKINVVNDLGALLDSEDYSDLILEVQNRKFKVHKYILAARSNVFAAMFKHDMKEKKENVVKICDINADVMEELLRFTYCGEVKNLDKHARELLAAAEMYNFPDLKKLCENSIIKSLDVNNVVDILEFAELYNSSLLKQQALNFFVIYVKDVVDTYSFKKLATEQSPILGQVITKMAKEQDD